MAFRIRTVRGEQVRDNGTQTARWDTGRAEWVVYCRERRRHFRGFLSVGNAQDFCDGKTRRAILVSCAATKLDRPAPAADLYTSPLFRKARSYAEASGHPWFVLSARHGLVEPTAVLEPYDTKLADLTPGERSAWADRVARDLYCRGFGGWGMFEIHAGDGYARPLRIALGPIALDIIEPLAGLGIGQRLHWYAIARGSRPASGEPSPPDTACSGVENRSLPEGTMGTITASVMFHGQELKDIQVLNPGGWFGKTWLIEIGGSYTPLLLVVEADSVQDAIDELADDEKYGWHIIVASGDLDDYPEESRHYGPSGQVLDLDHLLIHGQERAKVPFPCRYHGVGLPPEGVCPTEFGDEGDGDDTD